jgi:hypothetical protein
MADFINLTTYEIRRVHTPDYINNPEWANLNHKDYPKITLPDCDKKYWRTVNGEILEMTETQKTAVDEAEVEAQKQVQAEQIIQDKMRELAKVNLIRLKEWFTGFQD